MIPRLELVNLAKRRAFELVEESVALSDSEYARLCDVHGNDHEAAARCLAKLYLEDTVAEFSD